MNRVLTFTLMGPYGADEHDCSTCERRGCIRDGSLAFEEATEQAIVTLQGLCKLARAACSELLDMKPGWDERLSQIGMELALYQDEVGEIGDVLDAYERMCILQRGMR